MQNTLKQRPSTGVSVAVFNDNAVLLTLRGKVPYKGYWSLPGGTQEFGETMEDAARRELTEETSLIAETLQFVELFEPISRDDKGSAIVHFVLGVYACTRFTGKALAGDDAEAVQWCALDKLDAVKITPGTLAAIIRAKAHCDTQN